MQSLTFKNERLEKFLKNYTNSGWSGIFSYREENRDDRPRLLFRAKNRPEEQQLSVISGGGRDYIEGMNVINSNEILPIDIIKFYITTENRTNYTGARWRKVECC